jgi:branched-chain amino acid transport system substrate-binding protein
MLKSGISIGIVVSGGLVFAASAPARDLITLGAAISLTGAYTVDGEHTQRGYELATRKINGMGGVKIGDKTYDLKVKYYDDESTPTRGAELAERLIKQDGVQFMLGPYGSGPTKAIAPITEANKVPMVEGNGSSRALFTNGWHYLFATLSTAEQYLSSAIDLVAENASKLGKAPGEIRLALAFENDAGSQDVRAGVIDAAKAHGMQIVIDEQLPPELNDMTTVLVKTKALRPDVLVVSGHAKGATTAIRQIAEMQVRVPVLAMTHCDAADVIGKAPQAAEYTLCATQWAPTMGYKDGLFGTASDFAKLFRETYGYLPPYQAAQSAAAVEVFADAFKRAGVLDRQKVREALAATDIDTFFGHVKFDDAGRNIAKPMVLYQVLGGEFKIVAPSRFAETQAVIPRP